MCLCFKKYDDKSDKIKIKLTKKKEKKKELIYKQEVLE